MADGGGEVARVREMVEDEKFTFCPNLGLGFFFYRFK
jgi:hypothetical protein